MSEMSSEQVRLMFCDVFHKMRERKILDQVESRVCQVIEHYPQYHDLLANREGVNQAYSMDENPYLQMSLHLAVVEQIETDQPPGVRGFYETQILKYPVDHVQKQMVKVLRQLIHRSLSELGLAFHQEYLQALWREFQV